LLLAEQIQTKEKELNLKIALNDAKTFSSYVKIPQIKEESTGQYHIDNYIHTKQYVITPKKKKKYGSKTEEQEWDELIVDIRKRIQENSVEDSKPTIEEDCNIETQSQDFVYDFHEVNKYAHINFL
jgi:hypothetical protein